MIVQFYSNEKRESWDNFVESSKNGTFMLKRGYLEYHSDRFMDSSLMFYEGERLLSVFPASRHDKELRSHGGLTYGGMIFDKRMTVAKTLEIFNAMLDFVRKLGVTHILYKRVPSIYYSYPSDEDLYALFRIGARLVRRDIAATIDLRNPIAFSSIRKRLVKRAINAGLEVRETIDFDGYVALLTDVLTVHHHAKPVHTGAELRLLSSRFPDVIKLFAAYDKGRMLAGVLIFDTPQVVHTQYIANSEEGRTVGALDLVMDYLINTYSQGKCYFDFGIATERDGMYLNEGLMGQKEMFGGRGISYDFYKIDV